MLKAIVAIIIGSSLGGVKSLVIIYSIQSTFNYPIWYFIIKLVSWLYNWLCSDVFY